MLLQIHTMNMVLYAFQAFIEWIFSRDVTNLGEDSSARIWDLRSRNLQCQRLFQMKSPVNCVCLHPNQGELFIGDQSGALHIWDIKSEKSEKIMPDPGAAFQSVSFDYAKEVTFGNQYLWLSEVKQVYRNKNYLEICKHCITFIEPIM